MSKETINLKYPMLDLLTGSTMSLMYLNMLAASNLLFLNAPWAFMATWMKGLEGCSVAAPDQQEPMLDNHQNGHML
jgi:hypothetical protein